MRVWAKEPFLLNILTSVLCQFEACAIIWCQAVDEPRPAYACGQLMQGSSIHIRTVADVRSALQSSTYFRYIDVFNNLNHKFPVYFWMTFSQYFRMNMQSH